MIKTSLAFWLMVYFLLTKTIHLLISLGGYKWKITKTKEATDIIQGTIVNVVLILIILFALGWL